MAEPQKIKPREINFEMPKDLSEKSEVSQNQIEKQEQKEEKKQDILTETTVEYNTNKTEPVEPKTKEKKVKESIEKIIEKQPIVAHIMEKFDAKVIN